MTWTKALAERGRALVERAKRGNHFGARRQPNAHEILEQTLDEIERLERVVSRRGEPVPMVLACPTCGEPHVDEGEWETRPHRTHLCLQCKAEFRPANIYTVGVAYLPENQYSAPRRADPRDTRIAELEQALNIYGTHLYGCDVSTATQQQLGMGAVDCTCGLDSARRKDGGQ